MVIVGYGQSNSYGGAPWKTSLATLRARPLARDEGQAGYRLGRGRLKRRACRPAGFTHPNCRVAPLERLRGGAFPRPPALRAEQASLFALPCFQCIPWLNNSPRSVETVRQAALPIRHNQLEPPTFCKEFVSKLLENIPIVSCIATPTQSRDDINCGKPSPVRAFVHMHYATLTQFMRSPS